MANFTECISRITIWGVSRRISDPKVYEHFIRMAVITKEEWS